LARNSSEAVLKQARPRLALTINRSYRGIDRATTMLFVAGAMLLIYGLSAKGASAEPLTVAPVTSGWERFNPTLELPRIYNPDGSLPSGAEMPALTPDDSPVDTNLPPPDPIDPSTSDSAPSVPAPITPAVTHGDPPVADGHHHDAASNAAGGGDDASAEGGGFPEPDPETLLSAPSALDPTDGTDQGVPTGNAENNAADPSGNTTGNAQNNQNQQVDVPSVVLIPPPYYGAPVPAYGYPYYGPVLGRYPSFGPAPAASVPAIPPNVRFGVMPPPGYPWIGALPMVPWSAIHPAMPAGQIGMPSSNLLMPKSHLSVPSLSGR
jgi:hypothetical protein